MKSIIYFVVLFSLSGCIKKGNMKVKVDINGDGHHEIDLFLGKKQSSNIEEKDL